MEPKTALILLVMAAFWAAGCGAPDVTGSTVDDAMNDRAAKSKALDAKEGKTPEDHSKEMEQDPQAGGGK